MASKKFIVLGVVDPREQNAWTEVNLCPVEFKNAAELGGYCFGVTAAKSGSPDDVDELIDELNTNPKLLEAVNMAINTTEKTLKIQLESVAELLK